MRRAIFSWVALLVAAPAGFSATIMFSGALSADDAVQTFVYSVQNTSLVTIDTTSFATGGFAPILSVFDNTGALQFFNDGATTNDCVNNAKDPCRINDHDGEHKE